MKVFESYELLISFFTYCLFFPLIIDSLFLLWVDNNKDMVLLFLLIKVINQ